MPAAASRRTLVVAALLAACATDSSGPHSPVETVSVIVPAGPVPVGATVQLNADLRDASGNPLTGRSVSWTSADTAVARVSSDGSVTGKSLGTTRVTATSEGKSGAADVTVVAGPAAVLVFTAPPSSATAGAAITPGVEVTARDVGGNTATSFAGTVTLAFAANAGGGTLTGGSATAVAGVASFPNVSIDKAGTGYTIRAMAGSLVSTASAGFDVTAGPATRLAFTALPGTARAGVTIAPPIVVSARDAFGNVATVFTGNVTVALAANPASGTLAGTTIVAAQSGVATFGDLSLNKAAAGYKLAALGTGLAGDTSSALTILPGPVSASHSLLSATPATIPASTGSSVSTVTVTVRDAFDNAIPGASVVLGATGSGNGITQPGTTTDANGMATGNLSSTVAESKTVSASAGGVSVAQTAIVTVTPAQNGALVFVAQPTSAVAGVALAPAVQVAARDAFGNTITTFNSAVAISIGTNPGGGTLSGTKSKSAVSGVATFSDLSIDKAASGYTLLAAGAITGGTSNPLSITPGSVAASQSALTVAPAGIIASTGSSSAVVTVTARDAFGNPIPGATVALAATGTGNTITQPGAPTNASGVATGAISSTVVGSKTVSATVNAVPLTQQGTVSVGPAAVAASQGSVVASPASIAASFGAVTAGITVTVRDTFGNAVPGAAVVLAATGTGNTLTQPASPTDANGVATGALSATLVGSKVVSATAGGKTLTATATVTVVPGEVSVTQSTVLASPASIAASTGASVSTITVTAKDEQGNVVPNLNVVLAATGTGNALTQPAAATNANGVATGTISSTVAGPRVISATIDGTGVSQTDTVTVTAGGATSLAFLVQPSSMTVGTIMTPPVQVEIRDQFGNRVSTNASVTLSFGTNAGGGTLTGGGSVAANLGLVTYASLSIDKAGMGYTLKATSTGLPDALSTSFNVTSGVVSAAQSTVSASPSSFTAGAGASTITVTAKDASGFPVVGATVVLSVSGTGNTVTQPASPTNSSGVTTGSFTSTGAESKTVTATVNGVTITQKPVVTVTAGPVSASQSTVSAAPASITVNSGTSSITVTAKDAYGNPVSGQAVVLAATGTGNTLTQPSSSTNGSGIATGSLSSSATGTKTVSATAGGVAVTQTATVTVTSAGSSVVFAGAGDIADCATTDDEATAALINAMPSSTQVFVLGDNVYPNGTSSEYKNCYNPSWGAFKSRTHPSAGNHEYNTTNASGYFGYFGAAAGTAGQGYYSFDLGSWHVIVLNSNIASDAGSPQDQWLLADLAAHKNVCTLAYWHHPLYSSIGGTGTGGAVITSARRFWDDLYAAGADLVLAGHRHVYERLAPMKPDGSLDPVNGIRTLIVGSGGESGGDLTNIFPTSEVREGHTFGVMKLTLSATSYTWEFVPVAGSTFTDTGSGNCH